MEDDVRHSQIVTLYFLLSMRIKFKLLQSSGLSIKIDDKEILIVRVKMDGHSLYKKNRSFRLWKARFAVYYTEGGQLRPP